MEKRLCQEEIKEYPYKKRIREIINNYSDTGLKKQETIKRINNLLSDKSMTLEKFKGKAIGFYNNGVVAYGVREQFNEKSRCKDLKDSSKLVSDIIAEIEKIEKENLITEIDAHDKRALNNSKSRSKKRDFNRYINKINDTKRLESMLENKDYKFNGECINDDFKGLIFDRIFELNPLKIKLENFIKDITPLESQNYTLLQKIYDYFDDLIKAAASEGESSETNTQKKINIKVAGYITYKKYHLMDDMENLICEKFSSLADKVKDKGKISASQYLEIKGLKENWKKTEKITILNSVEEICKIAESKIAKLN